MSSFLVVSLNPTYQQIMGYDSVRTGQVNRTDRARSEFSGKGLNVARALARLGNSATLLTHMNPSRIAELRQQAASEGFNVLVVEDPSPVRTCVTVLQSGARGSGVTTTELVQESPAIEGEDTEAAVLSSVRTPASRVYPSIMAFIAASFIFRAFSRMPCSRICLGSRWRRRI